MCRALRDTRLGRQAGGRSEGAHGGQRPQHEQPRGLEELGHVGQGAHQLLAVRPQGAAPPQQEEQEPQAGDLGGHCGRQQGRVGGGSALAQGGRRGK